MKKSVAGVVLICALLSVLCGCNGPAGTQDGVVVSEIEEAAMPKSVETDVALPDSEKTPETQGEADENTMSADEESMDVTPYQFLYLLCGNAEELSVTYTMQKDDAENLETRQFQKRKNAAVESFTAQNMNGEPVSVRELETEEKVHYIMDDGGMVKTYLAPAEDFLLYRMLKAADTVPERIENADGYRLYEYSLPFAEDDTLRYNYSFFMQDGSLKKLTVTLGDREKTVYVFSEFRQGIADEAAFAYPEDYAEEIFDYRYDGEHMPPWWEIFNDE